jgi:uncharacterized protein with PQ loop repeat
VVRQLIPQIIINYRRHDTEGLQPSMMLLWAAAGLPLGVYSIIENFNIALRIQPQILTTLSLITWAQCVYYERVRNSPTPLVGNLADGAREYNNIEMAGIAMPVRLGPAGSVHGRR